MAIPVVASFTFDTVTTAGNSVTMTKPASVAVGDLLILLVGNEDNTGSTSFPAHSGWTKAYESGDATPDAKIGMYWRIADGTEGASETISWTATGNDAGGGWYLRITGADSVDPIHLLGTAAQSAGASSLAAPSLTTTLDNCLVFTHQSGDGGGTYPFTPSGTGWPGSVPTNQELQSGTAAGEWAGCWVTRSLASFGASNACTIAMSVLDGIVLRQFAVVEPQAGINSVTPSEFDMDTASVTIGGQLGFGATIGSSDVYLSPNDLLSEAGEVDITGAVNTWSDTSINLDLTQLSAAALALLHTMGPGARFIIVNVGGVPATTEYFSAVTLHRPEGFQMVLGAATPGTTTARLTGMSGTFGGGRIEETAAQNPSTTNTDVAADGNREDVWSVEAKVNSREVQYDFRVLYGGFDRATITQTPQVTISAGENIPVGAGALVLTGLAPTAGVSYRFAPGVPVTKRFGTLTDLGFNFPFQDVDTKVGSVFPHEGLPVALDHIDVMLSKGGSPTGNATLEIHTIALGNDYIGYEPADEDIPVATSSNSIDVTTLTGTRAQYTFDFAGEVLPAGMYAYVVAHVGDATNSIAVEAILNKNPNILGGLTQVIEYVTPPSPWFPPFAGWRFGTQPATSDGIEMAVFIRGSSILGHIPFLTVTSRFLPGEDALVLTGEAPTLSEGVARQPAEDVLVLTGLAPEVGVDYIAPPGEDTLVLTGLAPDLTKDLLRQPAEDALAFAGLAPSFRIDMYFPVLPGVLVDSQGSATTADGLTQFTNHSIGQAITLGSDIVAGSLRVILARADELISPPLIGNVFIEVYPVTEGTVGTNGEPADSETPSFVSATQIPAANLSSVSSEVFEFEFAPETTISAGDWAFVVTWEDADAADETVWVYHRTADVHAGNWVARNSSDIWSSSAAIDLSFSLWENPNRHHFIGRTPQVSVGASISISAAGALALTSETPTVEISYVFTPAEDVLVLTGEIPIALSAPVVLPAEDVLVLTGLAPSADIDYVIEVAGDVLVLTGLAPDLTKDLLRQPAEDALVLTGLAPSAEQSYVLSPPEDVLVLTGQAPALLSSYTSFPAEDVLVLTGLAPTTPGALFRAPGEDVLVISGLVPVPFREGARRPGEDTLVLTGLAPSAEVSYVLSPAEDVLVLTGQTIVPFREGERQPPEDALVLTGLAPAVDISYVLSPSEDVLLLSGLAPSLGGAIAALPGEDVLLITGLAPSAEIDYVLSPAEDALSLVGEIPVLFVSVKLNPAEYNLLFSNHAPSAEQSYVLSPAEDVLVINGLAPILAGEGAETPGTVDLFFTGEAPSVEVSYVLSPAEDVLVLAGLAPTDAEDQTYQPGEDVLVLAGLAPVVDVSYAIQVGPDTLLLIGNQPQVIVNHIALPGPDTLVFTGEIPVVDVAANDVTIPVDEDVLVISGQAVTILTGLGVQPAEDVLLLTGLAPSVEVSYVLSPAEDVLVIAGLAPGDFEDRFAQPAEDALVLTGQAPVLDQSYVLSPAQDSLILTGQAPALDRSYTIEVAEDVLVIAGQAPVDSDQQAYQPGEDALLLTGLAPSVETSYRFAPAEDALLVSGLAPTVERNYTIEVAPDALLFTGYESSIGGGVVIVPDGGTLLLSGLSPAVAVAVHATLPVANGSIVVTGLAPSAEFSYRFILGAGTLVITPIAPGAETGQLADASSSWIAPSRPTIWLAPPRASRWAAKRGNPRWVK